MCTACGSVSNVEDQHVCDPTQIPDKGEERTADGIWVDAETKEPLL